MSRKEIIELQDARPFHPIELTVSDGSKLIIEHPKWMLITPDGQTLHIVFRDAPTRRVDLEHITQAVALENTAAGDFSGGR